MSYILSNNLSSQPINCNVGYNNSWLRVENNANRELFAQANYITNFDDFSVSLSAGNITVDISDIENLVIQTNTLLKALTATSNRINGFVIPDYNTIKNYYFQATSNLEKVEYKQGSTIVATLSFTYVDPISGSNPRLNEVIKL